jgi:hypothetical protein
MIGEDNVSKEAAGLIVDEEIEDSGKTSLCNEIEGGTERDEGEGVKAEAEDSEMWGKTDSSKIT